MMETDDGCTEFAGDEEPAPRMVAPTAGAPDALNVPAPYSPEWVEARMASPQARRRRKEHLDAQLAEWHAEWLRLKGDAPEVREAAERRAAQQKRARRALGLAWLEPERLDEYASEAGVAPDKLRAVMATERGQAASALLASQLRDSGELLRVQTARATASLVTLIEQGIADGTVTTAMAPKIVESLAKLTAAQGTEPRNAKSPAAIDGDLEGLIGP